MMSAVQPDGERVKDAGGVAAKSFIRISYRSAFVIVSLFFGVVAFSIELRPTPDHIFVNLPWSLVYGLGWYALGQIWGLNSDPAILVGMFLWPVCIVWLSIWLSGKVWKQDRMVFTIFSLILLISWCVDVRLSVVMPPPFPPLYSVLYAAAY